MLIEVSQWGQNIVTKLSINEANEPPTGFSLCIQCMYTCYVVQCNIFDFDFRSHNQSGIKLNNSYI